MNNYYKSLLACACFVLCTVSTVFAQDVSVSGVVTTSDTGEGLPGVSITESGTTNGVITDIEGNYTISVPSGSKLTYSFVGYVTQEIEVGSQSSIDVVLEIDVQQLSEVVVIGYGQVKKSDLTGSVASVGPKDFNKGAIVSPQGLLQGRVAGMQITSSGGAPGAGSRIRIRGGSSLSASNEPLIVIDGVPVSNDNVSGMRNPLSIVNPNDIASISVLKDASATAIYGSRASNGVIIITTKRGSSDGVKFSYNGNMSVGTLPKKADIMSAAEFRNLLDARVADGDALAALAVALDGDANTEWLDEVFETAISMDHNLSATGAVAEIPYRVSLGYTDQKGILKTSKFNRTSLSLGFDPSLLDDNLKIKVNVKGMQAKNIFPNEGAIGAAASYDPRQPVFADNTMWGGYHTWDDSNLQPANPAAQIALVNNEATINRIIANTMVDYRLQFFPDVTVGVNVATDRSETEGLEIIEQTATWESSNESGLGKRNQYDQTMLNDLLEATVKYDKQLPGTAGKINFLAGYSWQHFKRENIDSLNNLEDNGSYTVPKRVFATESFIVSFFGRLNYSFKDKYLLTATLRRDGSSRFAEHQRWGLFPSVALAWNIDQEPFLKSSQTVSQIKLRAGYGVTGQQNIGRDYGSLARVSSATNSARYQFGSDYITPLRYEGYDANLRWEETTTINVGVDFGFLNDRITGSIEYYQRETTDLLNEIPVPIGTNFTNRLLTNIGSLENSGIEASINGYIFDREDLSWNVGVNVTKNTNKITKLTAVDDPDFIGVLVGGTGGGVGNTVQVHQVGQPASSFFVYEQVYNDQGTPIEGLYVDQNDDGTINDLDRVVSENPNPKVYLGFSSRLEVRNFDFSFNARANLGNYVYDNFNASNGQYSSTYTSQGYVGNVSRDILSTGFENNNYLSDYYLYDASFFRMDNISVGYKVSRFLSDDIDAYFNFTVQNAFVLTNYHGVDPEVQNAKDVVTGAEDAGIDNNLFPRPRTFVIGVSVNF